MNESTPTCRTCYAATLSDDERARFFAEAMTTTPEYCPEHRTIVDEMHKTLADMGLADKIVWSGSVSGRFPAKEPSLQFAGERGTPHDHTTYVEGCFRCDLSRDEICDHLWVAGGMSSDWVCEHCGEVSNS